MDLRKEMHQRTDNKSTSSLARCLCLCLCLAASALPLSVEAQPSASDITPKASLDTHALSAGGTHIPLARRDTSVLRKRDTVAVANWARREKARVVNRYGIHSASSGDDDEEEEDGRGLQPLRRRQEDEQGIEDDEYWNNSAAQTASATATESTGTGIAFQPETTGQVGREDITNYLADLEYYAPLQVGSAGETYNVILDTGSSDLWLAGINCNSDACGSVPRYNASASNSSVALDSDFSIQYGDGRASGNMFNDTITLAGLNATSAFAACDEISQDMVTGNVSGILGLGFEALSASGHLPYWQRLINTSLVEQQHLRDGEAANLPFHNLSFPGFSFALTRYINLTHPEDEAPGGLFTIGVLSNDSFVGNITYIDIPPDELSYWHIPMDSIQVDGQNVTDIGTPSVAIDTGTTLIGGPSDDVASLYSQIPDAQQAGDGYEGYWTFPCDANFSVSFGFGGRLFNMTDEDFNLGLFEEETDSSEARCLGAFFELELSQGTAAVISWVIGSAFLKNVYSVYRLAPNASVGFADLNEEALDEYYPYPQEEPTSTARVRGGAGPYGPPDAPSGGVSGSSAATATGQQGSIDDDYDAGASISPGQVSTVFTALAMGLAWTFFFAAH